MICRLNVKIALQCIYPLFNSSEPEVQDNTSNSLRLGTQITCNQRIKAFGWFIVCWRLVMEEIQRQIRTHFYIAFYVYILTQTQLSCCIHDELYVHVDSQFSSIKFIAEGSEMCVSWDFSLQGWTTEGCITIVGDDGVITCNCSHLTNFAVLVVMPNN